MNTNSRITEANSSLLFTEVEGSGLHCMTLTIIIPLRITNARIDLIDRVGHIFRDTTLPSYVTVLIVDDGSRPEHLALLKEKIEGTPISVLSTGAKHYQTFSFSRVRNFGAQHATSEYILFWDADLIPYDGFFRDLYSEIRYMASKGFANDFLMVPCIYLTEKGWAIFKQTPTEEKKFRIINAMLEQDDDLVQQYSTGTSAIVLRRDYYLARGGMDPRFLSWGYEDYEFICRLIRRSRQFPLSSNWLMPDSNFMKVKRYEGWKSVYRLHGEWMARKGIWAFHVPHKIEESFHSHKQKNWRLFLERLKDDAEGGEEPTPLADCSRGNSLVFEKNPFTCGREVVPHLGNLIFRKPEIFSRLSDLKSFIEAEKIDRIVFANPYKDASTQRAYQWCRENRYPILVCERGALPDSVYQDNSGFLSDSKNYARDAWDRPLTDKEVIDVQDYISSVRWGVKVLEKQANRIDLHLVKKGLGIKPHQKVLLVPFQQPGDTVVRFFSGAAGSFENFYNLISMLPEELGEEWVVVYKKHPTEDDLADIPGAKRADKFNINDLVEICDAVVVINSGTGLLAMLSGKPVFVLGKCWYSDPAMNHTFAEGREVTAREVAGVIKSGFELDYDKILRFVHYLRFVFYSFGIQHQRRVRYDNGSPITATAKIDYYEVRGFTEKPIIYRTKFEPISKTSPIFDRYDLDSLGLVKGPAVNLAVAADKSHAHCNTEKTTKGVSRRSAKLIKLYRSPRGFFGDSRNPFFRPLQHLFKR